ncbi:biotin transporter BioY [Bacillus kwashiorkori]|uniref:biotin transporter BioY n=1 Tax=Bacillus kwashiorkori TaxID=1522318 RepID=UPI001EF104DC|nr:biotin transporter BioY [Bacillus kwashiorkori]
MKGNENRLKRMTIVALFASMISILAQFTIPLPVIPITMQTLAIGLAATILGAKYGTYSVVLYCLLGAVGAPVFAGLNGGFHVILGNTGGFIIGFIPTAWVTGYILEKTSFTIRVAFIANIVGMFITLTFGTTWFKIVSETSWSVAFATSFTPFILVGLIKAYLASIIGIAVRKQLLQAKLLQPMFKVSA